ncbi:hypothetical protein VTJ04DRAFT_9388 [Mycothermus thermophilus]|uniref:uncharacterized protein n=1 Tax=Humicola insolens TaxID=85995 RepID=UPI0037433D0F
MATNQPTQHDAGAASAPPPVEDLKQPTKRPFDGHQQRKPKHRKKQPKQPKPMVEGSHEEILLFEVQAMLKAQRIADGTETDEVPEIDIASLPEVSAEIELDVVELSSTGDALARQKGSNHVYVVPFSVPGDTVKARVRHHNLDDGYTHTDFLSVVSPSPLRDDSRIRCKYFAACSGCQFQMLDYAEQLKIKRNIVVKAYRAFSGLSPDVVPDILPTIGSPLQYGYRTKLTPHFDGPPGCFRRKGPKQTFTSPPPFGFTPKGTRRVMDVEDCPIGTDAVRKGLAAERERLKTEYTKYTRGATILLRESTTRVRKSSPGEVVPVPEGLPADAVRVETDAYVDFKTCITDQNATATEYIDDFVFTNPAGAFFQNNNSILSPFTAYIREHILPRDNDDQTTGRKKPIKYLIDAYSGSGLFTITQASLFPGGSIGIDIAEKSIAFARRNAALNGLVGSREPTPTSTNNHGQRQNKTCKFIAADAPELFKSVRGVYDPDETVVVLDPPRKGCDASFLRQLLEYAPRRVVYVSCNVHTQARDVGILVRGSVQGFMPGEAAKEEAEGQKKVRYEIESIRGFDFFPQTGHVEGVAVLNRVDA